MAHPGRAVGRPKHRPVAESIATGNAARQASAEKQGEDRRGHEAEAVSRALHSPRNTGRGLSSGRSEEHTSELQSLMRNSYAVFCLKKKNKQDTEHSANIIQK